MITDNFIMSLEKTCLTLKDKYALDSIQFSTLVKRKQGDDFDDLVYTGKDGVLPYKDSQFIRDIKIVRGDKIVEARLPFIKLFASERPRIDEGFYAKSYPFFRCFDDFRDERLEAMTGALEF